MSLQTWRCPTCTFINHGDLATCEMCLIPKAAQLVIDGATNDQNDQEAVQIPASQAISKIVNEEKQNYIQNYTQNNNNNANNNVNNNVRVSSNINNNNVANSNNSNNNNNSNNSHNSHNSHQYLSRVSQEIVSNLVSIANDLYESKETNVVNAGIYLNNIVSSYEAMKDPTKSYGYVGFGIYCRNFGECFTIIKAQSFNYGNLGKYTNKFDTEPFGKKIKICQKNENNQRFKSIYDVIDTIRIKTNKVAHCVGNGIDAKKRFLTNQEKDQVFYNVYYVAKVLHKWKYVQNNKNIKQNNYNNNKSYNSNYNKYGKSNNYNNNNNNSNYNSYNSNHQRDGGRGGHGGQHGQYRSQQRQHNKHRNFNTNYNNRYGQY